MVLFKLYIWLNNLFFNFANFWTLYKSIILKVVNFWKVFSSRSQFTRMYSWYCILTTVHSFPLLYNILLLKYIKFYFPIYWMGMGLLAFLDIVTTTALKSFSICGLEHLVTGVTCPVVSLPKFIWNPNGYVALSQDRVFRR